MSVAELHMPDHDLGAEDAVVGTCVADLMMVDVVGLPPAAFFGQAQRRVYEALVALRAQGLTEADVPLIVDYLRRKGRLVEVGGVTGLGRMVESAPIAVDIAPHVKIIREAADVRALEAQLAAARARCRGAVGDRRQLLAEVRRQIEQATESQATNLALAVHDVDDVPEQLPPIAYLCERLHLAPGRPFFLSGYSNVGKTMLVVDLLLAIAAREDSGVTCWGGLTIQRHGKALMVDCEQGTYLTQLRMKRLAVGRWGNLKDWAGRLHYVCFPGFSLTQPDAEAVLTATLRGYAVAAFDSLTALTPGLDENSREISEPIALLTRVSEATGCAIIVLHHEGKPSENGPREARYRMRGHSSIQGGAGSHWAVTSLGDGRLQIEHGKSHWGSLRPLVTCQIVDVGEQGPDGAFAGVRLAPLASDVDANEGEALQAPSSLQKAKRAILNYLAANGETTSGVMKQALKNINNDTYSRAVRELVEEEGKVSRTPKGSTKVYALTSSQTSSQGGGMKSGETSSQTSSQGGGEGDE